jgi:Protein of unknown function (DUF3500)
MTGEAGPLAAVVQAWLDMLDAGQQERATFPFANEERFVWAYTPITHAGLALGDMTEPQRAAAMAILEASLSPRGVQETASVIALETALGEIERAAGRATWRRRDPQRYWFAVFGSPSEAGGPWSWRVGGHHVCVHVTIVDDRIAASTPSFFGANPAVVPGGPGGGRRTLTGEEGLARELLGSLSEAQAAVAVIDPVAPPDILSGNGRRAVVDLIAGGIARSALDVPQQHRFDALIRHYLARARDDVATEAWDRIADAGLDAITFAWAGPPEPGHGHYYAVHGPTFLLEYDNTQDGANHIHAVWRDLVDDWGEDTLARHYERSHA